MPVLQMILIGFIVACSVTILAFSNIYLVFKQSILRKKHEIGIMKAFGAKKSIILFKFLKI